MKWFVWPIIEICYKCWKSYQPRPFIIGLELKVRQVFRTPEAYLFFLSFPLGEGSLAIACHAHCCQLDDWLSQGHQMQDAAKALNRRGEKLNPCCPEFILKNMKYLHFLSFLYTEIIQVVEILPCMQNTDCSLCIVNTTAADVLLTQETRTSMSPGHQPPWHWSTLKPLISNAAL